jgi:Leucine-rich repeat (LRR) protein
LTPFEWLQELGIIDCCLSQLPPSIALLSELRMLELSRNELVSIDPIDFTLMPKLTWLEVCC